MSQPYGQGYGQQNPPPYNQAYPPPQGQGYNQGYPPQGHGYNQGYPPQQQQGYGQFNADSYQTPSGNPAGSTIYPASESQAESSYYGADKDFASFTEKSVRLGFVRKTFGILAVQLLLTGAVMCLFIFVDDIKEYSVDNPWLYIAAMVVYLVFAFALICVESLRRKAPQNIIILLLVTLAMSVMLGSIASHFDAEEVLMALGITFAVVLVCMGLGFQSKFDFTPMLGGLVAFSLALLMFGTFAAIFQSNLLNIMYASLGAFLFSLFLIVDVQMMMGGSHKYQVSPEEYIFAALNLYLDIVNIFLYILMIIASSKNN